MNMFKLPMKFADVFIRSIGDEEIVYEVRDKDTGLLVEPMRIAKYVEANGIVHFDMREVNKDLFAHIKNILA